MSQLSRARLLLFLCRSLSSRRIEWFCNRSGKSVPSWPPLCFKVVGAPPLQWGVLFFVCGAGGAGKSACLTVLRELVPKVVWWEFDDIGVPERPDKRWRQRSMEAWVRQALEHQEEGRDVGLCGQAAFGELLAAPSAERLDGVAACLLDVGDVERVDRLRRRGTPEAATQEMLNWSAWHRMHAVDPQWRQDVIVEDAEPGMRWERWRDWRRGNLGWRVTTHDTTGSSIREVARAVNEWCQGERLEHAAT
jgi:hypothetical protein